MKDPMFHKVCKELKEDYPPNKRMLLIQLPQMDLSTFNREIALNRAYYAFPPTGLQFLAAAVAHRDLNVEIFDYNFELLQAVHEDPEFDVSEWVNLLPLMAPFPHIVGISCIYDANVPALEELLGFLTHRNRDRSFTILGGGVPSHDPKWWLDTGRADFVVTKEGENKLNYLLDHITDENLVTTPIDGIYYVDGQEMLETKGEPDCNVIPPDLTNTYDWIAIEEYYKYGSLNPYSRMAGTPYATLQLNRGCRGNCTFCSVSSLYTKTVVTTRDLNHILDEIDFLYHVRGIRHFEWLDDDLLADRNAIGTILHHIIWRYGDITWSANNGLIVSSLDGDLLDQMVASGCIGFKIGIETGNRKMMLEIKKPCNLDVLRWLARKLDDYPSLFVGGNFILGLPGETFAQMLDTLRFALEIQLDWNSFTTYQPVHSHDNYIPTKDTANRTLVTDNTVLKGLDVFQLPWDEVPSREQVKEIWQTFNLLANYVAPPRSTEKFKRWIQAIQPAYPGNEKMQHFLELVK